MSSLFGLEAFTIAFAPRVSTWLLFVLAAAGFAVLIFALVKRAHGGVLRALAFLVLLAMLANPLLVRETREGIANVVALIVDKSQSMEIGERIAQADKAVAAMRAALKKLPGVEVRETEVHTDSGETGGTNLFTGLDQALSDVPPDRVAGAIMITDGEVHDTPPANQFALQAPLHVLLTGAPGERDRKLTVERAARFGIVGQQAEIVVRVDDFGSGDRPVAAGLTVHIDGKLFQQQSVVTGQEATITVPVAHGGENVVEIEASPGAEEQTLQNNRAAVVINGVRDRLRVLLVSGEPHAGERVWRNLLKADPSVDLVHFTILRPPEKQDGTPINELSLIAFPTRELFAERLDQFDLVIFDRYSRRDILPLAYFDNIAKYVQNGGALLLSSGPELAAVSSIYRTPLAAVLPAQPTREVIEQPFKPMITDAGKAHPVTRDLPQSSGPDGMPQWGRWFRVIGSQTVSGTTVMTGAGGHPLLVLDRVGQGRVAQLLSDQAWLWARGFEGGGPQAELLRRLAHWLMKEPDLEEEKLSADVSAGTLKLTRQTMAATAQPVTVTTPSGKEMQATMEKDTPGVFSARVKADELGLYHVSDGTLSAVAAAGPLNPREVADMRATDAILKPLAQKTGGAVDWIRDGVPDLRLVNEGADAHGAGWIAATRRNAYRVTAVAQQPLLPPWLALVLAIGLLGLAWRREGH